MANFTYTKVALLTIPSTGVVSQSLLVFGTSGTITNVSIALNSLTHTFPDDLDLLLVQPNGVRNLLFMSDAGSGSDINNVALTFSDGASSTLPDSAQIVSGTYKPTDYETNETDADFGTSTGGIQSASTTTFAAAFNGFAANGNWNLYVLDDTSGDVGTLDSWSLTISTNSGEARLAGTSQPDLLTILSNDGAAGSFQVNSNGSVEFSNVTSWDLSGGRGTDTVVFGSDTGNLFDIDLTGSNLTSIEVLQYSNPGTNGSGTVHIGASEIGAGFASTGTVLGTSDTSVTETFAVVMGTDTNVDLSTIAFNFFDGPTDRVTVTGDGSAETIIGSSVGNTIHGNGGNDHLTGGGSDDILEGGAGADVLNGGANGSFGDIASYQHSTAGVNVQLQYGIVQGGDAQGDTLIGIENLIGSSKADTLYGNSGTNTILGGEGNDHIKGLNGADVLAGEGGDDWIYADALDIVVNGGTGFDRLIVRGTAGVSINVDIASFEVATGNIGNDVFNGPGASANLTLHGLSGDDYLQGGSGDDYLYGDYGADQLIGGAGLDRLFIDSDDIVIDAGIGTADRLIVTGMGGVTVNMATANAEVAYGNAGNDVFDGGLSTDPLSLYGRAGADTLTGGTANDHLYGDNGTNVGDILNGGEGNDYLYGGTNTGGWAERDQFVFDADWGADRIFDFADNSFEKIDFSSIAGITQRSDLTITDGAGYALISYTDGGGWTGTIRVDGVTAADLQNSDFIYI